MCAKLIILPKKPDVNPVGYYVYIHYKLSNGFPFYVGKGKGSRAWQSYEYSRSKLWNMTFLKHGATVRICQDDMSEDDAFLLEMWLIAKLTNQGHRLVNLSAGGEGSSGHRSSEAMINISKSLGGRKVFCSNGMEFEIPADARKWLISIGFPKAQSPGITSCCRKINLTYLGFAWSYDGVPEVPIKVYREKIAEYCSRPIMDSEGNTYISIASAVRERVSLGLRASVSGIKAALDNPKKSAYGLRWTSI